MVSSSIIHAMELTIYCQDGRVIYGAGLRNQSIRWPKFESYSYHSVDIHIQGVFAKILNTCTWYLLRLSMPLILRETGRMAEWSKAMFLGTSHFGCVGSSPTPAILLKCLYKVLLPVFYTCTWYLLTSSMPLIL